MDDRAGASAAPGRSLAAVRAVLATPGFPARAETGALIAKL